MIRKLFFSEQILCTQWVENKSDKSSDDEGGTRRCVLPFECLLLLQNFGAPPDDTSTVSSVNILCARRFMTIPYIFRPIAKLYFPTPETIAYIFPSEPCARAGGSCLPLWNSHIKDLSQTALSICHKYKNSTCFCSLEQFYLTCLCDGGSKNKKNRRVRASLR